MEKHRIMRTYALVRIPLLLLGIFLLCSCRINSSVLDKSASSNDVVEMIPLNDTIRLSSLYDDTYCVVSFKNATLALITDVLKYDSLWIVKGKSDKGLLHLFNEEGYYLETILKVGQGPDEASNIWDMKIFKEHLYMLVDAGTCLLEYSLPEKKFVNRFRLPKDISSASDFAVIEEGKYVFLKPCSYSPQGKEFRLYAYNKKTDKLENHFVDMNKEASEYISFSQKNCLYAYDGKIRYFEVFRNGISQMEGDNLANYITFKTNRYTFPDNELYSNYTFDSFIDKCRNSDYIWAHSNLYEGNGYIMSTYKYRNNSYWNVINKTDMMVHSYRWINDDLLVNETLPVETYMSQVNVSGNLHYYIISYYELNEIMQKKKEEGTYGLFVEKYSSFATLYESLNEDSNDLMIEFHER